MTAYRVDIIESERGWGQKVDDRKYFTGPDALKKAEDFVIEHNRESMPPARVAPDIYWRAERPILVPDEEAEAAVNSVARAKAVADAAEFQEYLRLKAKFGNREA